MNDGPFSVWKMYLLLKLHFKGNMDYFRYNGESKSLSIDAFTTRKDRQFFERIHKKYKDDSKKFLLSCFVSLKRNPGDLYVHEMLDDEQYEEQWKRFQKVEVSLSRTFREDLVKLIRKSSTKDLKETLRAEENTPSLLLKQMFVGSFNIESYVILNKIVPVNQRYKTLFPYDPRVQNITNVCQFYDPFVNVDTEQSKQILREVVTQESL